MNVCSSGPCNRANNYISVHIRFDLERYLLNIQCKGWTMYRGKIMINDQWSDFYHVLSYLCTLSNVYIVYIPIACVLSFNPIGQSSSWHCFKLLCTQYF